MITEYLEGTNRLTSAREIAGALNLSYKSVVDGLNALYNEGRVMRSGRKFSALWGSVRLADDQESADNWSLLSAAWFGRR